MANTTMLTARHLHLVCLHLRKVSLTACGSKTVNVPVQPTAPERYEEKRCTFISSSTSNR
jgi:hypothetical protein